MLYLIQHGEAKSEAEDPQRPLTERGQADCRAVGKFLARKSVHLDRVLHSGKTRARQTAEIVADALGLAERVAQASDLEPNADPEVWKRRLDDIADEVMLVGHLPHLAHLAGLLLCGGPQRMPVEFRPGSVLLLTRREGTRAWAVAGMITPDLAQ